MPTSWQGRQTPCGKELRDTVKSLQPEKYAALEKELKEVEKAYGQATKKAEGFGGSLLS
ncbi:hypothetical protein NXW13_00745 [Bacteroides thetaiotaomicron]|nr:hypothetical protein [Bacteroides thetaiotaomicron]